MCDKAAFDIAPQVQQQLPRPITAIDDERSNVLLALLRLKAAQRRQ